MKKSKSNGGIGRSTNSINDGAPQQCLQSLLKSNSKSQSNAINYLTDHSFPAAADAGPKMVGALLIQGAARLDWLLRDARREVAAMFTEAEFLLMLHCYRDVFLTPEDLEHMVLAVCAFLGIDPATHEQSDHADFISRIELMTSYHRAALAGALEVAWHAGPNPLPAVARLGIVFQ